MRDGSGLSEHMRESLKVAYHQHHESVGSFWGVYELLSSSVGLSISPPMLHSMLRALNVQLSGAPPRPTSANKATSIVSADGLPSLERAGVPCTNALLLEHLFCIVDELTTGCYAEFFGDDDMQLLRLALEHESLAVDGVEDHQQGSSERCNSVSLIRKMLPATVRSKLLNFVHTSASSSSSDTVVDVEEAWQYISSLRNQRHSRRKSLRSGPDVDGDEDSCDVGGPHASLPTDLLTKDMARLFSKVQHRELDGGASSETNSQQTSGTCGPLARSLTELSSLSPLRTSASKTSLLKVRKSFTHSLDFSKSPSQSSKVERGESHVFGDVAQPSSPVFSDASDDGDDTTARFPSADIAAMPPQEAHQGLFSVDDAAGAAEGILRAAISSAEGGSIEQVLQPGELDKVEATLAKAELRRTSLLVRHESVQDMFEHRKRTTRLSSVTFSGGVGLGDRRTSLVSFTGDVEGPVEVEPVDRVEGHPNDADASARWKKLKRSIAALQYGKHDTDSAQVSHRSAAISGNDDPLATNRSMSSASRPSTSRSCTSFVSAKQQRALFTRQEKLLLQGKRVQRKTLDREIVALDPVCCGYLQRDVAKTVSIMRGQLLGKAEGRQQGDLLFRSETCSLASGSPSYSRTRPDDCVNSRPNSQPSGSWSPCSTMSFPVAQRPPRDELSTPTMSLRSLRCLAHQKKMSERDEVSQVASPHWGRWTSGGH